MAEYLLAYDVGTTAAKVVLFHPSGRAAAKASCPYDTLFPHADWAEQNPEHWWAAIAKATREVLKKLPGAKKHILAIGATGQMLGCLPVDAQNKPLRNAIIHTDARAIPQWQTLDEALGLERVYAITGNRVAPQSTLCKIMWLKECEPATYKKASMFLQSKDFLTARLTGSLGHTDFSDASHSVLMDIAKRDWSADLLDAAGIDKNKLPQIRASSEVAGSLTKAAAKTLGLPSGLPVVVGGGDGACASVGAGATAAGQAYTYLGGTAWISLTMARPFIDPKMRVFNICGLDPQTCGVYGTVQNAGSAHRWIGDVLGVRSYRALEALMKKAPPGSHGLFFLPYLAGERTPLWDPHARGVYFGLSLAHGRAEIARAALEGVCYALRSVLEVLEEAQTIQNMKVIGGGAMSRLWLEMLAAVFGRRLLSLRISAEATSWGAAVAAGVGMGVFDSYSAAAQASTGTAQVVAPDEQLHAAYSRLFPFWKSLYPKLKSSYYSLHELTAKEAP